MIERIKLKVIDALGTTAMWFMIYLDDILDTVFTVAATYIAVTIISNFFFMPVQVNGSSMYPTLQNEELGFSNIIARRINDIERYDIVVIQMPDEKLVKRVIGLPGETVTCSNDCIYINGVPIEQDFLDEEYMKSDMAASNSEYFTNDFSYTVGENEYFCLGDNRLHSLDSRFYGAFSADQIVAVDVFCIYPLERFGEAD